MITSADAGRILATATAYDRRTVGAADLDAWAAAINHGAPWLTGVEAIAAVVAWYATNESGYMRPAHLITQATKMRRRRAGQAAAQNHAPGCRGLPAASVVHRPITGALPAGSGPARPHSEYRQALAELARRVALRHATDADENLDPSEKIRQKALQRKRADARLR